MSNPFPQITDFFLLGKTLKSHGTGGHLRLMVEDKFKPYFQKGTFVFLDLDGSKVPFEVSYADDGQHFVMGLAEVEDKDTSDLLAGKEIWVDATLVKARHRLSPRNTKGKWDKYAIHDTETGLVFPILRTEEYPQQLMAVIESNGREILIPLHEDLISSIDHGQNRLYLAIPDGLLDL